MKTTLFALSALALAALPLRAQELLLGDRFGQRVLRLNRATGAVINGSFIPDGVGSGLYDFQRPREVLQVPPFLLVLDTDADKLFRFIWDGATATYHSTLTPGIDDARGIAYDGAGTIYIANNGTANGAPGHALVRLTLGGALLPPLPINSLPIAQLDDVEFFNGELLIANAAMNRLERYSPAGPFLGYVSTSTTLITSPTSCMPALLSNDLIVASGLSATGVHKLDSAYAGVSFSSWAFWTVGAAAELSSGQYLLTGPSGLARLNPNTGGFAFLTTPGGVQPELFAAFDPLAVCSGGVAYCTSGTTSSGCVPLMNGSGGPSATALSGFTLGVTQLEGQKQGLIFYGVSGRALAAWGSSFLCVKSPTQRMSVLNSGGTAGACDGLLSEDWNAFMTAHPGALGSPRSAGQALQAQGWFRDPPSPKTTNLTNAVEFIVCP